MDIRLDGKRALITGGTRGIGRAIAAAFAEAGAELIINFAHDDEAAAETCAQLEQFGRKPLLVRGDAASVEFGRELAATAREHLGGLDILVNNAGVSHNTPFLALEPEEWHQAVHVNVNSLFAVTQPILNDMIKAKTAGRILNITSLCGVRPVAAVPVHYAATKAAMHGFTYTLAKEVGRYGITVNAIAPGLIETRFSVNLPLPRQKDFERFCPLGRIGKADEVAALAVFLVSEHNTYMTGETVVIGGGL